MKKKGQIAWDRENTFIKVISMALEPRGDMKEIEQWISDHVIQHNSIDNDKIGIFQAAQEELCKSFLRSSSTDKIQKLLSMYQKYTESSVHKLGLNIIKNVVESELNAYVLLESNKNFLKQQVNAFGPHLNEENQQICTAINTLLIGDCDDEVSS